MAHRREARGPVATEVGVNPLVGIEPEELADDFHREDLAIGEGGCRPAGAQARPVQERAEGVVDEAIDGGEEGLEVHGRLRLKHCACWHNTMSAARLPWTTASREKTRTWG